MCRGERIGTPPCTRLAHALLAPCQDRRCRQRGHKALVRTDVRGGLMTANVLLAGRQYHDLGSTPGLILGVTDEPPRRLANVLLMRGIVAHAKHPQPWTPVVRWDGQVLRFPHEDIGSLALLAEGAGDFQPAAGQSEPSSRKCARP